MKIWILKLLISVLVLVTLLWWADAETVASQLGSADLGWLFLALMALTLSTFLMARRWQIVANALDIRLAFLHALAEYYVAQLANVVLPGGVMGDVGRAFRIRQKGDLTRAAQSVGAERLIGQAFMFALMAMGFAAALLVPGGIDWPSMVCLAIIALGLAVLAATVISKNASPTGRFLRLVIELSRRPRVIALSFMIAGLLIFGLYACARAVGAIIDPQEIVTLSSLVLLSMLIPLSVGGWGWREGAAAALFPLVGQTPSQGIATGIAYGAVITIAALPAVIFLVTSRNKDKSLHQPELDAL